MIEFVSTFKERLNEALFIREMKPKDLSERTGISESTISQYRSGYAKPKEDKLAIISNALDVNPVWLMGLNVPMELDDPIKIDETSANVIECEIGYTKNKVKPVRLFNYEYNIIKHYRKADGLTRSMVMRLLGIEPRPFKPIGNQQTKDDEETNH